MSVLALVVVALAWLGSAFALIAAVGIIRMPDVFTRLQASSKAPAVSITLIALAAALRVGEAVVAIRAVALVLLVFVTSPIAAHLIARAAFMSGSKLARGTYVETERHD